MTASQPRKLLCVTAHPDDECYAFGGALALAARDGVQTSVLCLTDGQAATHRGDASSGPQLGAIRRKEFHDSCRVLGVHQAELLNYQDAQLEFADFSAIARLLVQLIRATQPDVVLTFGSDGAANSHPDHTMVSAFTTAAFHWAGNPKRYPEAGPIFRPARLFHQTTDFFIPDRPTPSPHPWTVSLDIRPVFPLKLEAFRQHVSQAPLMERVKPLFEAHGTFERYALVASRETTEARQLTSLFEGLEAGTETSPPQANSQ
jgi:LmbE family N-acetylglucosaminyl deacetylase